MAQLPGSTATTDIVGIAEDVRDALYDISTKDTPFVRLVGDTGEIKDTFHKWHTDKLRAPAINRKPQANKYDFATKVQPVESANYVQISDDTISVAGTTEATKMYGRGQSRGGELSRLKKKLAKELMVDVEHACVGISDGSDYVAVTGTAGSFTSFLTSNTDAGAGGADGGYSSGTKKTAARTDGTLRSFTEAQLKTVQQAAYSSFGDPNFLMLSTQLKPTFSGFQGIGAHRQNHEMKGRNTREAAILATADIYIGDFGTLAVVPNRHQRDRDALLIDPNMVEMGYLRRLKSDKLAKQADSEDWAMVVEFTLIVRNEAAHGLVADAQP